MEFLKKRKTAFIVLCVVMVFGTIIGVNRSLSSLAGRIEDTFYELDGETPIDVYLDNRTNAAKMLVIIADNYPELSDERDALYDAYNDLIMAEDISAKYEANEIMQNAFAELYTELADLDTISDEHFEDAEDYAATISNTQDKIERSSYNKEVDKFDDIKSSFPLLLLRPLIFTDGPEYFAPEG